MYIVHAEFRAQPTTFFFIYLFFLEIGFGMHDILIVSKSTKKKKKKNKKKHIFAVCLIFAKAVLVTNLLMKTTETHTMPHSCT